MALLNVTDMDLTEVEEIISHTFSDKSMLKEALTTAGVPLLCTGARVSLDGNKRLAIIGDAILQLALAEEWYEGNTARGKLLDLRFSTCLSILAPNVHYQRISTSNSKR